ncbi:NEQ002 [Nanoarchaeum equitans Kin4-M]|uniref:peptidylprolyl isomerase n=1 Tax=Nanoarchaeum equitans (strain Kin4-M) TaxID=228908 RepID=Q74N36_NANEQ|nr:NEQ002 [Nanoarchaeum equitans Kin4-M]
MLKEGDYIEGKIKIYEGEKLLLEDKILTKLGSGLYNKEIENNLIGKEGEKIELEFDENNNPFGKRNPKNIVIVPAKVFRENRLIPIPGLVVNMDGKTGIVLTVNSDRVLVDFNHPLAGKKIKIIIEDIKKLDRKEFLEKLAQNLGYKDVIEEKDGQLIIKSKILESLVQRFSL